MSPTTTSLRVGSLSKNCRKSESIHWITLLHLHDFSSKNAALCWLFYKQYGPARSGPWPPCWSSEGNGEYPCGWTQTTHLHRLRGRVTDQLAFHTAALRKTTSQRRRSTSVPAGSESKNNVVNNCWRRPWCSGATKMSKDETLAKWIFLSLRRSLSVEEYLWSNVVGGAAEGCSAILSKHIFLAHAKISNLYVSLMVQHHVV